MARTTPPTQALQQLPKKWAVAIVGALILYALLQPVANSRLGWHLPSLASLMGMEKPATKIDTKDSAKATKSTQEEVPSDPKTKNGDRADVDRRDDDERNKTEANKPNAKADATLKYGYLKDIGKEVYVSPAGLRYTRGSEEGHRLKHLERHLEDDPDRPGKHGVFDGDMEQALRWIDDAYTRGKQGAKGVRVRDEDGRKVYEVPFSKPIGYVGGRDGRRDKNPEARKLRLVVDGDRVITAFPF